MERPCSDQAISATLAIAPVERLFRIAFKMIRPERYRLSDKTLK